MVAGSTENSTDEDASLAGRSPLVHVVHTKQVVVGPPVVGNDIVWKWSAAISTGRVIGRSSHSPANEPSCIGAGCLNTVG